MWVTDEYEGNGNTGNSDGYEGGWVGSSAAYEAPARRVITAHAAAEGAGYTDLRVGGSALIGWIGPVNGAVPGRLLTYFYDRAAGRSSAASADTAHVWVQSESEAIEFLQDN